MLRADLISEIVNARLDKGFTQKQLEQMSGVKQQLIARVETRNTNPTIETVLRILAPLGKTLAVIDTDRS